MAIRFSHEEAHRLLESIVKLNAEPHPASLARRTLGAVENIVACDIVTFDGFDERDQYQQTQWHNNDEILTAQSLAVFPHVVHEHPIIPEVVVRKRQDAMMMTDFVGQQEFERTALYNEFFKLIKIKFQMGMALPVESGLTISCAVNRARREFSEAERAALGLLAPHLLAAIRTARAFEQLADNAARFSAALSKAARALIVFDERGEIVFSTENAVEVVEKYFGEFDKTRLPGALRDYVEQHAAARNAAEIQPPLQPLRAVSAHGELIARVSFDAEKQETWLLLEEKRALSPQILARLGLTARETTILYWMAQGKSDQIIARLCGISPRTVHKHCQNIYVKLGVETRTAAMLKAIEVL